MPNIAFPDLLLYFTIYSVFGWICETILCSILARKLVNRGFLAGPYCPIYGFGALIIVFLLDPFADNPLILFLMATVSATLLEYFTSWAMEAMFRIRWWDYSDKRLNIKGRVCLENALIFGALGLCVTYGAHPFLSEIITAMPVEDKRVIASLLLAVFSIDTIATLNSLFKLDERLNKLKHKFEAAEKYNEEYSWFDKRDLKKSLLKLEETYKGTDDKELPETAGKIQSLTRVRSVGRRLLYAFPHMKHTSLEEQMSILKEKLKETANGVQEGFWKIIKGRTVNAAVKVGENVKALANELSFYKLFWIFLISSIVGFVVETGFCFFTTGYIESRQGLLYGPFSPVYGFGAVVMTILLKRLEKHGDIWIFIASALVGGAYEFLTSFLQELMFGTISWHYTTEMVSIGGRTSLLYMGFWGVLGVFLMKVIYPGVSRFTDRLRKRPGTVITWILLCIMGLNMAVSALAVTRWSARASGIEPRNAVDEYMDRAYPDSFMEEVYPNMTIVGR